MGVYKTNGKESLLALLKSQPDRSFSVEQIHDKLGPDAPGVSTVYRLCSNLVRTGEIKKYPDSAKEGYVFQYAKDLHCEAHIHMQCESCGAIYHLSCDMNEHLAEHLSEDHGFIIDPSRSLLLGLCRSCYEKRSAHVGNA